MEHFVNVKRPCQADPRAVACGGRSQSSPHFHLESVQAAPGKYDRKGGAVGGRCGAAAFIRKSWKRKLRKCGGGVWYWIKDPMIWETLIQLVALIGSEIRSRFGLWSWSQEPWARRRRSTPIYAGEHRQRTIGDSESSTTATRKESSLRPLASVTSSGGDADLALSTNDEGEENDSRESTVDNGRQF